MNHNFTLTAYAVYLPAALLLTHFVARTLFRNGLVYMRDIFHGREELAAATNSLFRIGFYLLNLGFALLILRIAGGLPDAQSTIEALSHKLGGFSLYLGLMLLFNLYLLLRGKKAARRAAAPATTTALS